MRSIVDQVVAKFGAEDHEQWAVIKYCDREGIPIWHVPNNTYTQNRFAKVKNKLLGVRAGIPDLFFIANNTLGVIEMKSKTGTATKEQKEWIAKLKAAGVPAIVAKGADQAIAFINNVSAGITEPIEIRTDAGDRHILPASDELPF